MKRSNKLSKIVTSALFATLILGAVPLTSVSADLPPYQSYGQIIFQSDNAVTLPENPFDPNPDKPVRPIDPIMPDGPNLGTAGPLSIDYASSFEFGTQLIPSDGKDHEYNATAQAFSEPDDSGDGFVSPGDPGEIGSNLGGSLSDKAPLYAQVTDKRGNENAGWTLKATVSDFTNKGETLAGVSIKIDGINTITEKGNTAGISPGAPTGSVELVPNAATTIMSAGTDDTATHNGFGTWLSVFGSASDLGTEKDATGGDRNVDKAVRLVVPESAEIADGTYEAEVNWELSDTPGSD
ncbi:WxL domain-containing protein [Periweissella cryptocerci]|nr:WxL domain-containing protein [Periweissella cryptocerci]